MKKTLTILLTLCLLFTMLPVTASAAEEDVIGGSFEQNLYWELDKSSGVLTISGTGAMANKGSPSYTPWADYRDLIVAIEIEEGVTTIGSQAFALLTNLEHVSIPDSVKWVCEYAFQGCRKLEKVHLPDTVTLIDQAAFMNCTGLKEINIPNTASVRKWAFNGCAELEEINLPAPALGPGNTVLPSFQEEVFLGCTRLKTVTIEEGFNSLKRNMFKGCTALTEIKIPDSVTLIPGGCFEGCSSLGKITLGSGLETIGDYAFKDCKPLTKLTIPASVTRIGSSFISECGVKELYFEGSAPEFHPYAFNLASFVAYYNPDDPTWNSETMLKYGASNSIGWAPHGHVHEYSTSGMESTCTVGGYIAYTCAGCKYTYVEYLSALGHNYVNGVCTRCYLRDPEWDGSAASSSWGGNINWKLTQDGTLILSGEGAAARASNPSDYPWYPHAAQIRKVIIEEGVTNVPEAAFSFVYPNLTDVELKSVEIIDYSAFNSCESLKNVILPDTLKEIRNGAFACTVLESIDIPEGVTEIGNNAFLETKLTEIILPEGLKYLGDGAFSQCKELKSAYLPDSIESAGLNLFGGCTALETANIPAGLNYVPDMMFDGCTSLKEIEIPEGITVFGLTCFRGTALTTITIPRSVTFLGSPFGDCLKLKEVYFVGDAPQIGADCFKNITATAYYPAGNATWTEAVMQNYCGTITWVPYDAPSEFTVKWSSISTSLGGNIAMNFYVELSENLVSDPDAYIQFSFAGRTLKVALSEGKATDKNGTTVYQFSCPITSKNMTDEITAQVYNGSGKVGEPKSMSVDTYCNWVIANFKDAKTVNLMKGMLNYGASAQLLFKYRTDDLANASLAEADKVFGAVDASAYKHSVVGTEEGIIAKSMTLLLDSETTVRVYFELTGDKTIEDYTFTVDGIEVQPAFKDGKYYIERPNISAHRLDDMYVFTCGGITVTYGGLSYVNQVMTYYTEGATFEMASALYAYSKAAEAYIG